MEQERSQLEDELAPFFIDMRGRVLWVCWLMIDLFKVLLTLWLQRIIILILYRFSKDSPLAHVHH